MKKMLEYDLVRRLFYRDHLSIREISRQTGYHRRTINRMLQYSAPPGYCLKNPRPKTKLAPFIPIIDQILEDDRKAPKKQRHTAKRIFDRLKDEHCFEGKYTIVKDYVRDKKIRLKEVFFPLKQEPGTAQVDFGQAKVVIAGVEQQAHFFCMALPFSDAVFLQGYPTEGFEAFAAGHVAAYEFFEGVPHEHLYDNPKPLVKGIGKGHERELTDDFLRLRSHHLFESRFCNVRRANEKGVVENLIGYARRNYLVPVLSFPSFEDMNAYLRKQCKKRLLLKAAGKEQTIGELLDQERAHFLPVPTQEFEACRNESRRVNSLSLVKFKNNSYSVPVEYAHRNVLVKVFVFFIHICCKETLIAVHRRSYLSNDFTFDPLHYLPLLKSKPGALEAARPFSEWELPDNFATLQRCLIARNGNEGKREYIKVLQLLCQFPVEQISLAIESAFKHGCINFEAVRLLVKFGQEPDLSMLRLSQEQVSGLPQVLVALTDITCYGALLAGGEGR